jgi:carboxymethylenebutenolidase
MADVLIPTSRGEMPAYLASPIDLATNGRAPGVVILHDIFGMTRDHRSQADWLAAAGFLALAPELFHHGGKISCIRTAFRDLATRRGTTFDDIEASRDWLLQRAECSSKVGVIGFCLGGGFAILLASERGFSACSINYGPKLPDDLELLLAGACPIVASYGAKDHATKGSAARLECELEKAAIAHDVKEYPDAGHGFMNNHQGLFFKMVRFTGFGYEEESALDARNRIVSFFCDHLHRHSQATDPTS